MSEWKEYKLGDTVKFSSGGTPLKSKQEFWGGQIPWISASSMEGYTYSDSKLKITELGLKNGSRIAPKNSLLILVRGSILHQKLQVGIVEKEVSFNQDVKCIQPIEEIIDPWFLLFWFKSEERNLLNKVENTGIGAGKLDTSVLQNLVIHVPPKNERDQLNSIFKSIQNKIELNRQMNQTLEAMAQALFKSWFVDFDPVMDNLLAGQAGALAAGNDIPDELRAMAEKRRSVIASGTKQSYRLIDTNPELAAKFPSSFVFNETLGRWIPEGWEVKKAEEIAKISIGKTPPRKEQHWFETIKSDSNYTWVSIKNMGNSGMYISDSDEYLTAESVSKFNVNKVPSDTVILSFKMTVGRVAITTKELCTNEAIAHFVNPKHSVFSGYIYQYLKIFDYESLGSTSSIATAVNSKLIKQIPFLVPSAPILSLFKKSVTKINKRIFETQNQTETLTQLRDRLLPELISGRMRVPIDTK